MSRYTLITIIASVLIFLSGCKKEDDIIDLPDDPENELLTFSNYSFTKDNNPELDQDVVFSIIENRITGRLPHEANINDMIPSFKYTGSYVEVDSSLQESDISSLDFSNPVEYRIVGNSGEFEKYTVDATYFTGLPIIHIYTDNYVEISSKEEYFNGKAVIYGGREFPNVTGEINIRGRGHSTWFLHPKKPYQLKFDDKTDILGMPEAKKWIFLAEYSDKSLIRTRLAFEMGYVSNLDWTPRCEYAEVFVNDDYVGTYNITEKVEEGEYRVNVGNDGYLLEIDTPDHIEDGDITFYSSKFLFQIKEPEILTSSPEYDHIVNYIAEFEDVLYGNNFNDPVEGYHKYIDVDSFIDWFLINEIAKNVDARNYSSIYLNYIPGEKIKMGPLWDFDLGFGNVDYADSRYTHGFWVYYNSYINRLMEDPDFVNKVKSRYNYFYSNKEYFMQKINEQAQVLIYAQEENNNQWDLFGNYVWPNPVYYNSHLEEVNHLKSWLNDRMDWLNDAFENI